MELRHQDITYIKGVGSKRADILRKELKVQTAMDLLRQYPYKYIDRSRMYRIADIDDEDTYVQIVGTVTEWHTVGVGKTARLEATFNDGTHTVKLVWFGPAIKYVKLAANTPYLLFGKPSRFNHEYNFTHPELTPMSKVTPEMQKGLQPYYNTTEAMKKGGLNSKAIMGIMSALMPDLKLGIADTLGADIVNRYHLMSLTQALVNIHFPQDHASMQRARERLKFEELFYLQLHILRQMKRREQSDGLPTPIVGPRFHSFYRSLPYPLTGAQKRVVHEIHEDMKSGKQMNRLLQGDVGSGKTLVAMLCALLAVDNGYQCAIMAPTEILAHQHYENISAMMTEAKLSNGEPVARVALLTGSTTPKQRQELHQRLRAGEIDILIGTHALIEDEVQFANLGLAIIDEQHRFGVAQRAKLWNKNSQPPHVLVMTATPIPRTLAMTAYGDLKVSMIDELPPGRKAVQTVQFSINSKATVYSFMQRQIDAGRQVYIVFPLIKENEKLNLRDLEQGYQEIVEAFPQYTVSMVHGQMKNADKDAQMARFASGESQILVATTVIEVGVNVPNASVMVIENAEQFGLSQLHQLRGRVGRGADQSYCILMTKVGLTKEAKRKIDIMVATNDGFRIAEEDLALRGPGDLEGTQQSGLPMELTIASLVTDGQILTIARDAAMAILDADPTLEQPVNKLYRERLSVLRQTAVNWGEIS